MKFETHHFKAGDPLPPWLAPGASKGAFGPDVEVDRFEDGSARVFPSPTAGDWKYMLFFDSPDEPVLCGPITIFLAPRDRTNCDREQSRTASWEAFEGDLGGPSDR